MSNLISRQAAIDAIKSRKTAEQSSAGIMRNAVVDFCIDIVKKLPSARSEIIRCGECRHLHDNDCPVVGWGRDDDDYCAWAERDNDE